MGFRHAPTYVPRTLLKVSQELKSEELWGNSTPLADHAARSMVGYTSAKIDLYSGNHGLTRWDLGGSTELPSYCCLGKAAQHKRASLERGGDGNIHFNLIPHKSLRGWEPLQSHCVAYSFLQGLNSGGQITHTSN